MPPASALATSRSLGCDTLDANELDRSHRADRQVGVGRRHRWRDIAFQRNQRALGRGSFAPADAEPTNYRRSSRSRAQSEWNRADARAETSADRTGRSLRRLDRGDRAAFVYDGERLATVLDCVEDVVEALRGVRYADLVHGLIIGC